MGALGPLYTYTYTALFGAFWACFCFGLSMGKEGKSLSVFWREQSEPPASHRLPSAIIRYCSSLYRQWASCVKFLCAGAKEPAGNDAGYDFDSIVGGVNDDAGSFGVAGIIPVMLSGCRYRSRPSGSTRAPAPMLFPCDVGNRRHNAAWRAARSSLLPQRT